jgi:uncharacterized phage protein gp47/JayE
MMPVERPSLTELNDRAAADLQTHLDGADTQLRRGNVNVLGSMHAGACHGLYGYLARMFSQILPDTAEVEYLERQASLWGITRKPAAKASGDITLSGTSGSVVPAGTLWERSDGARFETTAEATLVEGAATVAVVASEAGADGDTPADSLMGLVPYVPGLDQTATVATGGITGGADAETDDALRARVITRMQEPPAGGAQNDYTAWAMQVSGVTRAYCYPNRLGPGTVGVTVLCDDADGGPIPGPAVIEAVQDHIDGLRPVTAAVTVFGCTAEPVDFDIRLQGVDTEAVRSAVIAELTDLFRRESEPEGGVLISHIREAISIAAGEHDHVINSPTADVSAGTGELLTVGSFTWEDA